MIEVELPDGSVAEFDPSTPPEQIKAAVAKFAAPKKPTIQERADKQRSGMSVFRKALYGGERALDEAALGLKQAVVGLDPQEEEDLAVRRQVEKDIPGSWASRAAGDIALLAAPGTKIAGAVQAGAKALPRALARAGGSKVAGAAAAGAGTAALAPTLGDESRVENAAAGGLFGAGGQVVGDLGARAIEGVVKKNPQISKFASKVRDKLTLGQSADPNSLSGRFFANTEEKMQSIPLVGEIIRTARQKGRDTWRDDIVAGVSPSRNLPSGENTRDQLSEVYRDFQTRYANALRGHQINPSQMFEAALLKATNNPRSGLPQKEQDEIRDMAMRYYKSMFHGNAATAPAGTGLVTQGGHRGTPISMDASNAKDFEAFLTGQAAQFRRSNTPGSDARAKMFEDIERAWSTSYRRALPSSARVPLRQLDRDYAPYKTVERAASYVGNEGGDFTPQQLLSAVKARTPAPKFARGGGILQDEAEAARGALIDRVPNSGTADRTMQFGALGAAWADPTTTLSALGLAVPAMVTKTGRDAMLGDTRLQEILKRLRADEALRKSGMPAGIAANQLLTDDYSE